MNDSRQNIWIYTVEHFNNGAADTFLQLNTLHLWFVCKGHKHILLPNNSSKLQKLC